MSYRAPGMAEAGPPARSSSRGGSIASMFSGAQSPVAHQVDKATSDLLIGPDWGMNMEICDSLNTDPGQTRDAMKAVRKRITHRNSKTVLLTLTLLETMVKNCGEFVHQQVAEKDILPEMVKIVRKKSDMQVRDKILELLDSWQEAFGGPDGRYPQYWSAFNELRSSGIAFPRRSLGQSVPVFTPPSRALAASGGGGAPESEFGIPAEGRPMPPRQDESGAMTLSEMRNVRSGVEVLAEMLTAVDPHDPRAVHDEIIAELAAQARAGQQRIATLVSNTSDEEMMRQGLALNDEVTKVLARHDAIAGGRPLPADESTVAAAADLARFDHEEDVAADEEFSHLAHRSTLRERMEASPPPSQNASAAARAPIAALPPPPPPPRSAYERTMADLLGDGEPAAAPAAVPAPPSSPFGDEKPFQSGGGAFQQAQLALPPPAALPQATASQPQEERPQWGAGGYQPPAQYASQEPSPAQQAPPASRAAAAGQSYLPGFPPLTIYSSPQPSPPGEPRAHYEPPQQQPPPVAQIEYRVADSARPYAAPQQSSYSPAQAPGTRDLASAAAGGFQQPAPGQDADSAARTYALPPPLAESPPSFTRPYGASPVVRAIPPPPGEALSERNRRQQQQQQQQQQQRQAPPVGNPFEEEGEFKALPVPTVESVPHGRGANGEEQPFAGFQPQVQVENNYVAPWAKPRQPPAPQPSPTPQPAPQPSPMPPPPPQASFVPAAPSEQQPPWSQALDDSREASKLAPTQQQGAAAASSPPTSKPASPGGAPADLPPPPSAHVERQQFFQQHQELSPKGVGLGRRAGHLSPGDQPGARDGAEDAAAVTDVSDQTGQMSLDASSEGVAGAGLGLPGQQQARLRLAPAEQKEATTLKPTLQQLAKNQNPINDLFGDLVDLSSARRQLSPRAVLGGPISGGPPLRRPRA